ncbi:MAG: hypothetical protein OXC06_08065 [Acidimicrobiaceae bacterium]|nr:hypothetical protein [Acidimicrobiaceae bacterium]
MTSTTRSGTAFAASCARRARHIIELADETLTVYDLRTGTNIDPSR